MPLPLDHQLCFTLYATSMAVTRSYKPMLDAMGITYPQYLVLNVLGEQDGATIGTVADRLSLDSSTVTPLVKRLEQAKLVTRRRSTVDERQVQVWLTDEGRSRLEESTCLGEALIRNSGLSEAKIAAMTRQVQSLRSAVVAGLAAHPLPS